MTRCYVTLLKCIYFLQQSLSVSLSSRTRGTETVLLHIVNDILSALDNDNISVPVLLDLSATFCQIVLSRLNSVFGIQSTALAPMVSVIPLRQISIHFSQYKLRLRHHQSQLRYGVPQGSVLGPILFIRRLSPIS